MKKIHILIILFVLFSNNLSSAAEKLVVATGEWSPYTSESMDNKGFVSEIVTIVAKMMNREAEIRFYPWRRCYQYVVWGKVWAAYPYSFTEERAKEVAFSDDVAFSTSKFFYFSKSREKPSFVYNELNDLRQYKVGGVIGYYYEERFKEANLKIDYVAKETNALEKLFLGRIQLLPMNEMVGWELIRKTFPENVNKFGTLENPLDRQSLKLIVDKKNQKSMKLLERFNSQFKIFMKSDQYKQIMDKYTGQ